MEDSSPRQRRLNTLKERQQRLIEKLHRLEMDSDDETDVTRQMSAEKNIANTKQTLSEIEQEITTLEIAPLIQQANEAKNNQNYAKAIQRWHDVLARQADHPSAVPALAELEDKIRYQAQAQQLMRKLALHVGVLKPIWNDLFAQLRTPSSSEEFKGLINITTNYCADEMSAEDFILWFNAAIRQTPQKKQTSRDLNNIAQRIQRGDMVLFLGSDIAKHYHKDCLNEQQIAQKLAQQEDYPRFTGPLAAIAEYYQAQAGIGANILLERLHNHLPKQPHAINLYQHLAKTQVAQVIITTVYDDLLEQTFLAANKPFVRLTSFINASDYYKIGYVKVHYSDQPEKDQIITAEALSKLKFIQQGYSIIYKMRGTCDKESLEERDALILTERQFFDFARHGSGMIPSNLTQEIRKRGFLFLGYRPRSWDDRLLVKILLSKRQNADEPCHVLTTTSEPLEDAHWKQHNVERSPFDLSDLDACLAGDMSHE